MSSNHTAVQAVLLQAGTNPAGRNKLAEELTALQRYRIQSILQAPLCRSPAPTPYRGPNRSLLATMMTFPLSKRMDMICVAAHVRRNSLSEPWGIAFSMFDDHRFIFGKVKDHGRSIMEWGHVIFSRQYLLKPQEIFIPATVVGGTTEHYAQRLQHHTRRLSAPCEIHQQLLPGDLVLCIDGYEPSAFQTLTRLTTYLQSVTHFSVVVLRHREVTSAAMAQISSSSESDNAPFRVSSTADRIWREVLSPANTQAIVYSSYPSSMVRQVTPDRNAFADVSKHSFSTSNAHATDDKTASFLSRPVPKPLKVKKPRKTAISLLISWRNPWFTDAHGEGLPFDDNWEFSPEDGTRASLFLPPLADFPVWLSERKGKWRSKYKVSKHAFENCDEDFESEDCTVTNDFWSTQGFSSFEEWMSKSIAKWNLSYGWNRRKRQQIQQACEEVVQISLDPRIFDHWLRVRRNQWRLLRRKRKRDRQEAMVAERRITKKKPEREHSSSEEGGGIDSGANQKRRRLLTAAFDEIAAIDVILEQEYLERRRKNMKKRDPFDISFLFDEKKGAPDDVVVHCLHFLGVTEYAKLLCISKATSQALKGRNQVWRQLCPTHWILPRRPRRPWYHLFFHKLHIEQRDSQKRWDDVLSKCSGVLFKGDLLQKIEKLVNKGGKDFGFHVNYVSPVVCERNSLLNLAVIHQRYKVVRWLVDEKGADIESYDRGHFTALLNAAWTGDRQLVRLLMQRGADRTKIGYGHYSKALAHPDFKGLTAEGWARERGHREISELIRLGL